MAKIERVLTYDNNNPKDFPDAHALLYPKNHRYVRQGTFAFGDRSVNYASDGFSACSGLVMRSVDQSTFGLFHVLPHQGFEFNEPDQLKAFRRGEVILIEGTRSSKKSLMLADMEETLGVNLVDTLSLDTERPGIGNMHFQVGYRPSENRILVARNSHKDLSVYTAFE
jgi:hypothetical protein